MEKGASKIYKLNSDELEGVQEIVLHEHWNALIKCIEVHIKDIEDQIHTIDPKSDNCGTMLLIERSKSVGARTLLNRIKNLKAKA